MQHQEDIENKLRSAIAHNELIVHYQPIIRIPCQKVAGYEALIRWPDSNYTPSDFLPIAKQSGLISDITRKVMFDAAHKLKSLPQLKGKWISVNVSSCGFDGPLAAAVRGHQIQPHRLALEITEDTQMNAELLHRIEGVRRIGHPIRLDDYGTGRSNLAWLQKLGADAIKIDRQFIQGVDENANKQAIVRSTIELMHSLRPHIEVICEGVESDDELQFVSAAGADYIQGWLSGRPGPLP